MSMHGELEETGFVVLDERFKSCFVGHARVERLWSGSRWAEGPAWFAAGRYLVWSDIPNNRMLRWDETDGSVSVFREPSNNSNGNAIDLEGRMVTCEHLTRRITRTEHDGSVTVLCDRFEGKRLNSPNDLVVKSDGSIWFTDPTYGIDTDYEGDYGAEEIGGSHVYRIDPQASAVRQMTHDVVRPNGIAFSPDEDLLYVVDTGVTHIPDGPRHIRRFRVGPDQSLTGGEVFATCTVGLFDGIRVDRQGRVWAAAADGIHCHDADGTLIGKVLVPETCSNLAFAGAKRNRLMICGTTSLYSVFLTSNGAGR
jgi:gluconolactonase